MVPDKPEWQKEETAENEPNKDIKIGIENYWEEIKLFFKTNRLAIFYLGVMVGCLLSFIVINLPTDFFTTEPPPVEAPGEPVADLVEKYDIPINERIEARIKFWLEPGMRDNLIKFHKRSGRYLPMIKSIFKEYNLPEMLAYLPVLESGFSPHSTSRVGAVGLWQFMWGTGSEYGLKISRSIDERRDPVKSTIAAAEYLQYLFDTLGDWELALASYNYGPAKLRRAMRRDKTKNYWELKHIPRETYNFVPSFYAVLHIISDPDEYEVEFLEQDSPLEYEIVEIEGPSTIQQIADLANVTPEILKELNPELKGNLTPRDKYETKIPKDRAEHFVQQYIENPPDRIEVTHTTYRVKRGDTLAKIAKRFASTVSAIRDENNLKSTRWIRKGQVLKIPSLEVNVVSTPIKIEEELVAIEKVSDLESEAKIVELRYKVARTGVSIKTVARYYNVTEAELRAWNPGLKTERLKKNEALAIYKPESDLTIHKIRRGESLWLLARRYKTTVSNLRRWNGLTGSRIYTGDTLIVSLT